MDSVFLWAQLFGILAMSINIMAWQLKNPRLIIFSYAPASSLWAVQYFLLGAPLGVILNICSATKDLFLSFVKDSLVPYLLGAFLFVIWTVGLYFFEHWFDILPLIAGTIINVALLQRDNRSLIARAGIAAQVCWITYNLIVGSYMGVTSGCLGTISSVIGMARFEAWEIGKCYRTFLPSLARSILVFPDPKTYP